LEYITGDKRGLETKISTDVLPFIFRHISQFTKSKKNYSFSPVSSAAEDRIDP
jgi:hypothetical protein